MMGVVWVEFYVTVELYQIYFKLEKTIPGHDLSRCMQLSEVIYTGAYLIVLRPNIKIIHYKWVQEKFKENFHGTTIAYKLMSCEISKYQQAPGVSDYTVDAHIAY